MTLWSVTLSFSCSRLAFVSSLEGELVKSMGQSANESGSQVSTETVGKIGGSKNVCKWECHGRHKNTNKNG